MESTIIRGNRVPRQSSEYQPQYILPDAAVNCACRELRFMGNHSLANRLTPVAKGWFETPWMVEDVLSWESALTVALATEGLSEFSKGPLRGILEQVTDWLDEYVIYEQACIEDERETILNLGVAR